MATRPIVDNNAAPLPPAADRTQLAEELLDLAERAQSHAHAAGSAIALKLGEKLYVRTSSGVAPEVGSSLMMGEGAIGQCARLGKPCNVTEEDKIDTSLRALGVRSLVAVPIHHAGIFYGVLVAMAQTPEAFTRMQVAIMMTMGNEVARVLKRMETAAMEIAPGAPLRTSSVSSAIPDDNVIEISLTPTAKQGIVDTLKTIEQKPVPAPAPMKLLIDPPLAPKVAPPVETKSAMVAAPAPVLPAAAAIAALNLDGATPAPKPLPDLLPPGEDPRRYGTLKTAKSLEPKPAFVAANAFVQPRQSSSMKGPMIAAAAVIIAVIGFAAWRHNASAPAPKPVTAATEPAATVATPAPAPSPVVAVAKPAPPAPAPVVTAKPEPVKKSEPAEQAKVEPKPAEIAVAEPLRIAAPVKHADVATADAPSLTLASNTTLPDLGTPKIPAAKLLVKHSAVVPPAVLRTIPPVYPEIARRSGVFGVVRLEVTVSAAGTASNVRVLEGPQMLCPAASNAVSRWQYRAATVDGRAVESTMQVTVKFGQQ